jgi:hypothetical protein
MNKLGLSMSVMSRFRTSAVCFAVAWLSGCAWSWHKPFSQIQGDGKVIVQYSDEVQAGQLHPVIEGTINNIKGKFLIDTGVSDLVLTMRAIRACGIPLRKETGEVGTIGDRSPTRLMKVDGIVKIEFGPHVVVTCGNVYVTEGMGSDMWFGLLDYRTLSAAHAVINVEEKTVTFSFPR